MATFGIHVALMRGIETVRFAPGDEVPEWAEELVGDHCLVADQPVQEFTAEHGPELVDVAAEPDDEDPDVPEGDVPDFTAPAKRTRRAR